MTHFNVPCPSSMQAYREALREFFSGMLRKLDMNSHKNTPTKVDLATIVDLMRGEISEFEEQITKDRFDQNSLEELQDAANYAFLAFLALRLEGVQTTKEKFLDEYYHINVDEGKVYIKKTRQGSLLKVGEEIKGTVRPGGYITIKFQSHRTGGLASGVPRSHLIWWKATGKWPIGVIDHLNGVKNDDRFQNLADVSFSENNFNTERSKNRILPRYVTPYMPRGRQHLAQYGKFVYQRYYNGLNIRCAYFDTPEEAAIQGQKAWETKVQTIKENLNVQ